jgi:transcriptional regulator with XRE-family HTH domain
MTISLKRLDQYDQGAVDVSLVGSRVRAARQSVGYSIDDLAETCGLTGAEIIEIEEGQDADPARLKRIASALQVSLESLLDEQA